MATAALLRAYLEWQAELGTDEVILPAPIVRAVAAAPTQLPHPVETPRAPIPSEVIRMDPAPAADAGLFATLSQALAESSAPAQAAAVAAARPKPAESAALPSFADLDAFWAHLYAHPGIAAGDPAAPVTRVIRGEGAMGAPLALVGLEPSEADAAAGMSFQGEAGALLAKMLKAIRLDAAACYKTNVVKAARPSKATRRDLGRLLPWLHSELALTGAPFVLLMGEACAQAVLKVGKAIEEMRQEPFRIEGREYAVTYHPAELLAKEELKRKAWEDLQWLQRRMSEGTR